MAVSLRGGAARQPECIDHNLRPVIHACFSHVTENQLLAFDLREQEAGNRKSVMVTYVEWVKTCAFVHLPVHFLLQEYGGRFPGSAPLHGLCL